MKIKKKDLMEAKFIVKPDDYDKIKDKVEDTDTVTLIDEDDEAVAGEEKVENDNEVMYVAYEKEYSDESPFIINGEKFEYCWAKYPSGKVDIAVYSYGTDVTYGYRWWRKTYLNESVKPIITKGDLIKFINENK